MQAACASPTLGSEITTPFMYLKNQWALWGTGEELIDSHTRIVLILNILYQLSQEDADFQLACKTGTAKLLAQFVAEYSGVDTFDAWITSSAERNDASAFPGQHAVQRVLAQYHAECQEAHLIEPGMAARRLPQDMCEPVRVHEELFAAPAIRNLIQGISVDDERQATAPNYTLVEDARMQFVVIQGSTVKYQALQEEIAASLQEKGSVPQHVVVFCERPFESYEVLSPSLTASDAFELPVLATCMSNKMLYQTTFGQALYTVFQLHKKDANWIIYASDFAYNRVSGIPLSDAINLNYEWRLNPIYSPEQAIAILSQASPTFSELYSFVAQIHDAPLEMLLAKLQNVKQSCLDHGCFSRRRPYEDEAAYSYIEQLIQTAHALKNPRLVFDMLFEITVSVTQSNSLSENLIHHTIEFLPYSEMDSFAPESVDEVIFSNVSKEALSIPKALPATVNILERLGIPFEHNDIDRLRASFSQALQSARSRLCFILPLRNPSGSQQYPSFVYDEFIEACSAGNTAVVLDDPEEVFKVPASHIQLVRTYDESNVVQGFGQTFTKAEDAPTAYLVERGIFNDSEVTQTFISNLASSINHKTPLLSPSQIESYINCPYQWFIERKIGIEKLDRSLDSALIGSCVHEIFRKTFEELALRGHNRITETNLEEARCIAQNIFDELVSLEISTDFEPPLLDRYSPGSETRANGEDDTILIRPKDEQGFYLLQDLRQRINENIAYMMSFPSNYQFFAGEYEIKEEDDINYAGAILKGFIDRVEVNNESKKFAILDYKGSLYNHESGISKSKDGSIEVKLPHKIQALIYASALSKKAPHPDLSAYTCAGAMYLSYKAQEESKYGVGSFDAAYFDMSRFAEKPKLSRVEMDFDDFLNAVENLVAPFVQQMMQAEIPPEPREGACRFCALTLCSHRRAQ